MRGTPNASAVFSRISCWPLLMTIAGVGLQGTPQRRTKFLEISALGAAGIYSRMEPYLSYVREGETGLFADNLEQSWSDALERLYCEPRLRSTIAARAHEEVRTRYSIEQAIPHLLRIFERTSR